MENFVDVRRNHPHGCYIAELWATGRSDEGTRHKSPEIIMSAGRIIRPANVWIAMAQSALTAGHAHVARQCRLQMPAVDHKVMPFRLTGNCLVDSRIKEFVALGRAQWTA
jgi:hypothetical protein